MAFSHFSSFNENINPRCLIWFLNSLFLKQYTVYKKDPKLLNLKDSIPPVQNGDGPYLPLFLNEVIEETYAQIQNDELKTILGLLNQRKRKRFSKRLIWFCLKKTNSILVI